KGVSLLFTNDTNLTISYGDSYILQVYCNEQWQEVDYIIDNWGFAMAYELPPHSTRSGCIKWSGFHGILSPGTYRIVKQIRAYNEAGSYTEHQIATNFVVES
ncbi:MAG: hypothetical protein IJF07_05750, partial [Lachnospiraceae bacterium]|nr:hypothetical protein [Lachnospiraceae bacterium]